MQSLFLHLFWVYITWLVYAKRSVYFQTDVVVKFWANNHRNTFLYSFVNNILRGCVFGVIIKKYKQRNKEQRMELIF